VGLAPRPPTAMNEDLNEITIDPALSFEQAQERLTALGLTDGLPVVPPTAQRIAAMLGNRDPHQRIAMLAPLHAEATLRRIAFCAVMAGCRPEHLPVVIATVQAAAEPEFNLLGVQTTTGTAAAAIIVNGPVARSLSINAGTNALGPGTPANAVIGRALALVLRNVGGAIPGELDMATIGQPGKYTFCFAENEQGSPWEPLHVTRGFKREESTVTVLAAAGTMEVRDECSKGAEELLMTFARSMLAVGSVSPGGLLSGGEPLLLLAPQHAKLIAREKTREAAQAFLFETARLPVSALPSATRAQLEKSRPASSTADLCVARQASDIMLVVVGGIGYKSAYVPTWGGDTRAITKRITDV
jgi:hypothetical protein